MNALEMNPPVLISAQALADSLTGEGGPLVVDCRYALADPEQGWRAFVDAHLPTAVYCHLDRDLADLSRTAHGHGRHPLPTALVFMQRLLAWGWRPGRKLVAYDAAGGAVAAARLWWMMRLLGQPAQVLDGGWQAWQALQTTVESGSPSIPTQLDVTVASVADTHFEERALPGSEHLPSLLEQGGLLLDARTAERFRGDIEPIDRVAGHVPGAQNRPYQSNLDEQGLFKPAAMLRQEFEALLGTCPAGQVVHMCGSGVTACHNLLAMEHAGLHGSRVYVASWSGWSSDPQRPVARGGGLRS